MIARNPRELPLMGVSFAILRKQQTGIIAQIVVNEKV